MVKKHIQNYNAAIYLRISKEDKDSGLEEKRVSNSIVNQKNLIMDFLKDKPEIKVFSIYEDDGYSGVDFTRPAFSRMMEGIKCGDVNCVIVKDLSRFGRNYIESGRYLEKIFPLLGVRFIAVNDGYDSLYFDIAYDITIPFKNIINDSYCADLSMKIRSHLNTKRKNGEFTGSFTCYGYIKDPDDKNRLKIDEYPASVVKNIFRMKINGFSPGKIAEYLNKYGILSPLDYKRSKGIKFETPFSVNSSSLWSAKAVLRILSNEIYTGMMVQGKSATPNHKIKVRMKVPEKDWIRVGKTHEAIIKPGIFRIVKNLLERDTRIPPSKEAVSLLSGLIYCGECGSPMIRKTSYYGINKRTQEYSYFVCRSVNYPGEKICSGHRIKEKNLIDSVLSSINFHIESIINKNDIQKIVKKNLYRRLKIEEYNKLLNAKSQEYEKSVKIIRGLYDDLDSGLVTAEEYFKIRNEFSSRLNNIKKSIYMLRNDKKKFKKGVSDYYKDFDYLKKFRRFNRLTRSIVVIAVNRILVYDESRIRILFNFSDEIGKLLKHVN